MLEGLILSGVEHKVPTWYPGSWFDPEDKNLKSVCRIGKFLRSFILWIKTGGFWLSNKMVIFFFFFLIFQHHIEEISSMLTVQDNEISRK